MLPYKNNPGLQFSSIALQYDKSVLELQKDTPAVALKEALAIGEDVLGVMMGNGTNDLTRTMRFKVLDPSKSGAFDIVVADKVGDKETILSTVAAGPIDFKDPAKVAINKGSVTIPKVPEITTKEINVVEKIPFETKNENDPTLDRGTTKVKQEGVDGETTIVYAVTMTDGVETSRVEKDRNITLKPVDKIVLNGTKDIVEIKEETRKEVIPFGTITKNTDTLEVGQTAVEVTGVDGERSIVEKITRTNGVVTNVELMSAKVTKEQVDKVVLVGTKAPVDVTAPIITRLYSSTVSSGNAMKIEIKVDDEAAKITVTGLPEGVTYDPATREISGTPTKEGTYSITVKAVDSANNSSEQTFDIVVNAQSEVAPNDDKKETEVSAKTSTRISGDNRFLTAVEISKANYTTVDTVLIVDGHNYPDALAATVFGHVKKAPILLGTTNAIPKETLDEVSRLGAKNVIIIGGTSAISEKAAEAFGDYEVTRIAGADRYETADKIAEQIVQIIGKKDAVVFAQGSNFPDALSVSALAIKEKAPLLLTRPAALTEGTAKVLASIAPDKIYVAGGTAAVAQSVEKDFKKVGTVQRIGGNDRYETAALIAAVAYPEATKAVVASDVEYIDAMVAGPLTAIYQAPILPVMKNAVPSSIADYIKGEGKKLSSFIVIGGTAAITEAVVSTLTK